MQCLKDARTVTKESGVPGRVRGARQLAPPWGENAKELLGGSNPHHWDTSVKLALKSKTRNQIKGHSMHYGSFG